MSIGPSVLFRVAGGPRAGFGHVVRALSLAKALHVVPRLSVRGTPETQRVARGLGAHVEEDGLATALRKRHAELLVIDDPHAPAAAAALAIARRLKRPVASVHDLGLAPIASDLAIDGSLAQVRHTWPAAATLLGPRYAVLDPMLLTALPALQSQAEGRQRVLVSLGGGRRTDRALRIARAIADAHPDAWVTLAAGFGVHRIATGHARVRVLESPAWLRSELSRADVAVVAGGLTLYEAAALGVATVAVPVVPAQVPTIRAFDRAGAAFAAIPPVTSQPSSPQRDETLGRVIVAVGTLLGDEGKRRALGAAAHAQIDGRGALRVADALRALLSSSATTSAEKVEKDDGDVGAGEDAGAGAHWRHV